MTGLVIDRLQTLFVFLNASSHLSFRFVFKVCSRCEYSVACCACLQGFYHNLFLTFRLIQLHFPPISPNPHLNGCESECLLAVRIQFVRRALM